MPCDRLCVAEPLGLLRAAGIGLIAVVAAVLGGMALARSQQRPAIAIGVGASSLFGRLLSFTVRLPS